MANTSGLPKDFWSERMLFGLLIILGYLLLLILSMVFPVIVAVLLNAAKLTIVMPAVKDGAATVRDGLLVIGPLLGLIVQAIWKADKADKDNAASLATLSTAAAATMATAPPPAAAAAPAAAPLPDRPGWVPDQ